MAIATPKFNFRDLPAHDLEGVTRNFEQIKALGITGEPGAPVAQTRELTKTYQPSSSRPSFVMLTILLGAGAAEAPVAEVLVGAGKPTTIIAEPEVNNANAAGINVKWPISFFLPAGWFYEVKKKAGTVQLSLVFEQVV